MRTDWETTQTWQKKHDQLIQVILSQPKNSPEATLLNFCKSLTTKMRTVVWLNQSIE